MPSDPSFVIFKEHDGPALVVNMLNISTIIDKGGETVTIELSGGFTHEVERSGWDNFRATHTERRT